MEEKLMTQLWSEMDKEVKMDLGQAKLNDTCGTVSKKSRGQLIRNLLTKFTYQIHLPDSGANW